MPNLISKKKIFVIAALIFGITMSSVFMFVEKEETDHSKTDYQIFILKNFDSDSEPDEEEYRKILQDNNNEFIIVNADRTFKFITPDLEKVHGYTLEEMKSDNVNVLTFVHPKDLPAFSNILMEFHRDLEVLRNVGPVRVKTKNGDYLNYLITLIPFVNDGGVRVGTGVIFINIEKPLGDTQSSL